MKRTRFLVLSVSVIVLASCASVPVTDDNLPTPDIAPSWSEIDQSADPSASNVRHGWLDDLHMTELSDFVDEVLKNNPNFQSTAHRMAAAGYNVKVSRAGLMPTLNASLGVSRRNIVNPFAPSNNVSIGLDSRWEVDVWGKLSARHKSSNEDYKASLFDQEAARLSLAAQVAQAWFDVLEAEAQLKLSRQTEERFTQSWRVVRNRFQRGLSTGLDLRLITSSLEAERARLSDREDQLSAQRRRLELLAGRYPAAKIMASGEIPDLIGDVPVGIPVNILERRPDLRAAKARLLGAGYDSQAADKDLLPSFTLTANGSNSSVGFSDMFDLDNIFWTVLGNLTQPIFQGGRLRYSAKAQAALFEAEKQNFTRIVLDAFREVEDALSSERSLKKRVEHTTKAAENAVAAADVALDQYSRGLIKISVLLDSQRQSLNQQSQLLSIRKQRINNRITLHLALGGDFNTQEDIQALTTNESASVGSISKGDAL